METVDISQVLRDAENALRDFISALLAKSLGPDWISASGVTKERVEEWERRKTTEEKKQRAGVVEERLIYYADFYDLKTILKRRWGQDFAEVFGEWKRMDVLLDILNDLRNPEAHRRELLPHQKHLAAGISGEIRSLIVRYRSKHETTDDYFPRIESARDSIGTLWTPDQDLLSSIKIVSSDQYLRPGDSLDYIVSASDPLGDSLEYGISINSEPYTWQEHGTFSIEIIPDHVGRHFPVEIRIRSNRDYHAKHQYDDGVTFMYTVLPLRKL